MSQSGKKNPSLARRRTSRQWLTFLRVCRYGANNFTRNAWLTTAATAVMTVTLVIIFSTLMARNVFNDTITDLRQRLDISFYLEDNVTESQRAGLVRKLKEQDFVTNVTYVSKEEARESFVEQGGNELEQLEAIDALEGENPFPASLRINVTNPDQLDRLEEVFDTKEFQAAQNPNPSFENTTQSDRRESIDNIARAAAFTERTGLVLSVVAVTISVLIIFNTIRMAIFNRRDEIQMMKLIGADRNFIQGPFIVEAVMYGLFAALVTSAIVFPLALTRSDYLNQYGVMVAPTVQFIETYALLVVLAMMLVGALIGVISSYLAIRRYLKV